MRPLINRCLFGASSRLLSLFFLFAISDRSAIHLAGLSQRRLNCFAGLPQRQTRFTFVLERFHLLEFIRSPRKRYSILWANLKAKRIS